MTRSATKGAGLLQVAHGARGVSRAVVVLAVAFATLMMATPPLALLTVPSDTSAAPPPPPQRVMVSRLA